MVIPLLTPLVTNVWHHHHRQYTCRSVLSIAQDIIYRVTMHCSARYSEPRWSRLEGGWQQGHNSLAWSSAAAAAPSPHSCFKWSPADAKQDVAHCVALAVEMACCVQMFASARNAKTEVRTVLIMSKRTFSLTMILSTTVNKTSDIDIAFRVKTFMIDLSDMCF